MPEIKDVRKQTDNRFLNIYELDARDRVGNSKPYFVASRAKTAEDLKLRTHNEKPDGVIIYALKEDKVLLIRQYLDALDEYIYEFPAGLVEPGEDLHDSAVREMYEETGLTFTPVSVDCAYEKPYFTTIGMTDESCATVYGYASGEISLDAQEDSEEIEVILAGRDEVRRILKEEKVAIMCAYMLMHFLEDEEPFGFLKKEI